MANPKTKEAQKKTGKELRDTIHEKLFMVLSIYNDQLEENALESILKKTSKTLAKDLGKAMNKKAKSAKKQKKSKKKMNALVM
jgi:hypothetical protein